MSGDLPKGEEKEAGPDLALAQTVYLFEQERKSGNASAEQAQKQIILEACFASNMTPFYESCCDKYGWTKDSAKVTSMR